MTVEITRRGNHVSVRLVDGTTAIESGYLLPKERDEFAMELLDVVWKIGPTGDRECVRWLAGLLTRYGL